MCFNTHFMMHLLHQIRELVESNSSQTVGGLFYTNKEYFSKQSKVEAYIKQAVSMLKVPRVHLGITVENKGWVRGGLTFYSCEKQQVVDSRNVAVTIEE